MKLATTLLAIILVIIVIGGCRPPTSSGAGSTYRKGTSGIGVNFLPGAPPARMYADYPYNIDIPITVEVRNLGAYPELKEINYWDDNSVIFISGFDPNIISGWKLGDDNGIDLLEGKFPYVKILDRREALVGKETNSPEGGYDMLEFTGYADLARIDVEKYSPTFMITACYDYQTRVDAQVCIDPRPFSTVMENKVCSIKDATFQSQGAPIAITRIEETALSNSIQFKIHFSNVGGGEVIARSQLKKCSLTEEGALQRSDMDLVKLRAVTIGSSALECNTLSIGGESGYARLVNGKGSVVCVFKANFISGQAAYTTPIHVELEYGYRTTTTKTLEITKVPQPVG